MLNSELMDKVIEAEATPVIHNIVEGTLTEEDKGKLKNFGHTTFFETANLLHSYKQAFIEGSKVEHDIMGIYEQTKGTVHSLNFELLNKTGIIMKRVDKEKIAAFFEHLGRVREELNSLIPLLKSKSSSVDEINKPMLELIVSINDQRVEIENRIALGQIIIERVDSSSTTQVAYYVTILSNQTQHLRIMRDILLMVNESISQLLRDTDRYSRNVKNIKGFVEAFSEMESAIQKEDNDLPVRSEPIRKGLDDVLSEMMALHSTSKSIEKSKLEFVDRIERFIASLNKPEEIVLKTEKTLFD